MATIGLTEDTPTQCHSTSAQKGTFLEDHATAAADVPEVLFGVYLESFCVSLCSLFRDTKETLWSIFGVSLVSLWYLFGVSLVSLWYRFAQ